jgi:NitT/TauT family transport system substrate-binding protein
MNKSKILLFSSIAILLLLGMFFIFNTSNNTLVGYTIFSNEKNSVDVGYLPLLINLPLYVALEEGYFDNYGIKVNAIEANSPNDVLNAILSGKLDGAGFLATPILYLSEERNPGKIKIFATGDETQENFVSAIIIRNDSKINKIDDLKGQKIGVYQGAVQVLFLKSIILGMGLDINDIEIVEISPTLQTQALQSGQFNVLSTVEPFNTIAVEKNIGKVFIENPRVKYILDPFPSVATPLSNNFINNYPELAKYYILALQDAIEFINQNPNEAKKHLVKYTPITDDIVYKVNILRFNLFGEENLTNMQEFADIMYDNGLLNSKIEVKSMFGEMSLIE